ncbi:MAG: GNAT family N-acetyltransferase [Niameybacter sp.]|uniref:GNAT family N-acetyltransferase n=1 Tax=Niameybacter sp. TaxID=2033640 RepID=UPI002FCBB785
MFIQYQNQIQTLPSLLKAYCEAEEGQDKAEKVALSDYLNAQDMAFIKWVQVVLHLGRNPQSGTDIPEELYNKTLQAFDMLKGWRPKEIEIRHMILKNPLHVYFQQGLEVLGIGPQEVTTNRLLMRPLGRQDLESIYALASDEEVAQFMRFFRHTSLEETQALLEEYLDESSCHSLAIFEQESKQFVGVFVFKKSEEDPQVYSLTTFTGKAYWNKGYSTEILEVMKPYGKEVIKAQTLMAYVVSENTGSCKVLEKNGFEVVKTLTFEDLSCPLLIYAFKLED